MQFAQMTLIFNFKIDIYQMIQTNEIEINFETLGVQYENYKKKHIPSNTTQNENIDDSENLAEQLTLMIKAGEIIQQKGNDINQENEQTQPKNQLNGVLSQMRSLLDTYNQVHDGEVNNDELVLKFFRNGEGTLNAFIEGNVLFLLSTWFNDCDSSELFLFNMNNRLLENVIYFETLPTGSFITGLGYQNDTLIISHTGFLGIHSNSILCYQPCLHKLYKEPRITFPKYQEESITALLMRVLYSDSDPKKT